MTYPAFLWHRITGEKELFLEAPNRPDDWIDTPPRPGLEPSSLREGEGAQQPLDLDQGTRPRARRPMAPKAKPEALATEAQIKQNTRPRARRPMAPKARPGLEPSSLREGGQSAGVKDPLILPAPPGDGKLIEGEAKPHALPDADMTAPGEGRTEQTREPLSLRVGEPLRKADVLALYEQRGLTPDKRKSAERLLAELKGS